MGSEPDQDSGVGRGGDGEESRKIAQFAVRGGEESCKAKRKGSLATACFHNEKPIIR